MLFATGFTSLPVSRGRVNGTIIGVLDAYCIEMAHMRQALHKCKCQCKCQWCPCGRTACAVALDSPGQKTTPLTHLLQYPTKNHTGTHAGPGFDSQACSDGLGASVTRRTCAAVQCRAAETGYALSFCTNVALGAPASFIQQNAHLHELVAVTLLLAVDLLGGHR